MSRRASALMVLGTASNVGKSLFVTALCRYLAQRNVSVAPFKAQNMSLNSAATPDGKEIGRAQALQAEAAGIVPNADMNPILLKPTSHSQSQVVVQGEVFGTVSASDYRRQNRAVLWPYVLESYDRLASAYDVIVIEGAGSPAEINLREGDIVNMHMAHAAAARCILVADIDRGGVFASVYGTLMLLDQADRERIAGFVVNKFRGDLELLRPGITMLEERCGIPCFGVVPHLDDIGLEEEDSVVLEPRVPGTPWPEQRSGDRLRIAVVSLPHLSNFTDFDALAEEPSVDMRYTDNAIDLTHADAIVIPGTKDTIADLHWLREKGLDAPIAGAAARGCHVAAICGGLQMLGRAIHDPLAVESGGSVMGLGLLDLETTFAASKTTIPVSGESFDGRAFHGYEIHVGETCYAESLAPFASIQRTNETLPRRDGAISAGGNVIATYVHGLFDDDAFRHGTIARMRESRGLAPAEPGMLRLRERAQRLDRVSASICASLDMERLLGGVLEPA